MVNEIETLRRSDMQRQIAAPPRYRPPTPTYQLSYAVEDETVLFDTLKLFLSYLDRAPGYHTMAERDRIEAFLRSLTSLVFAVPVSVLDHMLTPVQDEKASTSESEDGDADTMSDAGGASSVNGAASSARGKKGAQSTAAKKADLRKKAMKNATTGGGVGRTTRQGTGTPATSRDSTPVPVTGLEKEDTPLGEIEGSIEPEGLTMQLDEVAKDGESSYQREVPASAAGLDGMQGVETVQTATGSHASPSATATDEEMQPAPPTITTDANAAAENSTTPAPQWLESRDGASTGADGATGDANMPHLHSAGARGEQQLRRFNFFCNTAYYCAIRLLQV